MMRTKWIGLRNLRAAVVGFALLGMGVHCGGVDEPEESDDVIDALDESADPKADQLYSSLAGKYALVNAASNASLGAFESMELRADKTYESLLYCPECRVIPEVGTFKRLRKGQRTYLEFKAKDAASGAVSVTKYQYTRITFDKMELRKVGTSVKFQVEREPNDCRRDGCGPGRTCQVCWIRYVCVPDGAVC
jgi:hypothetical protein